MCHGVDVIAAGHAPDLRASAVSIDQPTFVAVVKDGALIPNGMPSFEEFDDAKLATVRQYIRSRNATWRAENIVNRQPAK